MARLEGAAWRTSTGGGGAFGEGEVSATDLSIARYRVSSDTHDAEPLPELDPNVASTGIIVDDDYKTKVKAYWQFFRKPYPDDTIDVFPDLRWGWEKHPWSVAQSDLGERDPWEVGGTSVELYETDEGLFWKHFYQRGFESSELAIQNGPILNLGAPRTVYTLALKFIWAGYDTLQGFEPDPDDEAPFTSQFHGLGSYRWFANMSSGAYSFGAVGTDTDGWSPNGDPRGPDDGQFYIGFKYGNFDPGPGDSQSLFQFFYYPIESCLRPDLARDSQELDAGNGNQGKYTFVMSCDGTITKVGMIQGHSGGEIEWFGDMTPFSYNRGGNSAGDVNMAMSQGVYSPFFELGAVDYGGFLGSSWSSWNGWVREYVIGGDPFDQTIGDIGHLEPLEGYPHLDQVRYRGHA